MSRPAPGRHPVSYTWALSVRDWLVHALAAPSSDPPGGVLLTRCGVRHPIAVARRGEVCPRCAATAGVPLLELV